MTDRQRAAHAACQLGEPPNWGVVVIGRNESQRLAASLRSVLVAKRPVVYVDSASTDDSCAIARSCGVAVAQLPPGAAPSAALARNIGARALTTAHPQVQLIQFLDGDCELTEAWVDVGPQLLASDEGLAAVCGFRHEIEPRRNAFHRAVEQEWQMGAVGNVDDFSGDVLLRRSWFERVGGYDPRAVAGEDTELSSRLRAAGGRIVRLDVVATVHDIAMGSGRQWVRRAVRGGYGAAAVAHLHRGTDGLFSDQVRRMLLWGALAPITGIVALPWTVLPAVVVGLRWMVSTARAARSVDNSAADRRDRLAWGVSCACAAVPGALGVARFHLDRWWRRGPTLVEYR